MDENNMIILTDSEGKENKFEILDIIEKDEIEYAVMLPEDSEDEVVIFRIAILDDESNEASYIEVEEDEIADEIFNEFLKRMEKEEK